MEIVIVNRDPSNPKRARQVRFASFDQGETELGRHEVVYLVAPETLRQHFGAIVESADKVIGALDQLVSEGQAFRITLA